MGTTREIKISDLIWFVISKWKLLIIAIVIGALLGAAYSYAITGKVKETEEEPAVAAAALTPETVTLEDLDSYDVSALNLYFQYQQLVNDQMDYIASAEFMQIDPYDAWLGSASYYIKCADTTTLGGVIRAYKDVLNELNSEYGELFSFSVDKDMAGYVTSEETEGDESEEAAALESVDTSAVGLSGSGILQVTFYGEEKEFCAQKLEEVEEELMARLPELNANLAPHTLEKISQYFSRDRSSTILNRQKKATDTLYTLTTYMNNVKKTFSQAATAYAEKVALDESITDYSSVVLTRSRKAREEVAEEVEKTEPKPGKRHVIKKLVLLGALLIFAAALLLLGVYYILSRKLRPEDDFAGLFGLPCFGVARDPKRKKKNPLDRRIEGECLKNTMLLESPAAEEMLAASIALRMEKEEKKTVYATGTRFGDAERELAEKTQTLLKEKGIDLMVGQPVMKDAAAVAGMGDAGNVILIERSLKTTRPETAALIRFCTERGVKPLGLSVVY